MPLNATGLANRVYATADVVLRVATDHPDAVPDARTESVAAPAARGAGIRTPRLLAFDDSRALVNRPFSIWERVHGETLGCAGWTFAGANESGTRSATRSQSSMAASVPALTLTAISTRQVTS